MTRTALRFLLALACALILGDPRANAAEPRRILYGTTASPSNLPIWVAKDAGYFAQRGLNVEPVQIRGGSLIALAIITNDLPFSGVGAESVVAARAAGGDVVLLACPVDADPVYLITRPEIKSAAELKGQASAVTRYGSSTHFYLRAALKHVGLNPDKLAGARRLEHDRSCLSLFLRHQQPRLYPSGAKDNRRFSQSLCRGHPSHQERSQVCGKIILEVDARKRCYDY